MLREAKGVRKLLIFEGNTAYLKNEGSKLKLQVISGNVVKFGDLIELNIDDIVVITTLSHGNIVVSVSNYRGFAIFEEEYYEILPSQRIAEWKKNQEKDMEKRSTVEKIITNMLLLLA